MDLREYAEDELNSLFVSRLTRAALRHATRWWHFLICWSFRRRHWFRVSISCLLDISPRDNLHFLIASRSTSKVGYLEPMGGAVKYEEEARQKLDPLGFLPETGDRDLRVRLRGAQFPGLIRWFETGGGREPGYFTVHREMIEELRALGLDALADSAPVLQLRLVRLVEEWPRERFPLQPGDSSSQDGGFYYQYRRHHVFRPVVQPASAEADWLAELIQVASAADKAELVSKSQILGHKPLPPKWRGVVPSAESFVRGSVESLDIAQRPDAS